MTNITSKFNSTGAHSNGSRNEFESPIVRAALNQLISMQPGTTDQHVKTLMEGVDGKPSCSKPFGLE
ncbi:hypothetical protein [Youngiibacter fragilis]|uniref:hypothetical protein n=1 Tax=Youngiibacter fragilis TaxID=1408819 RepID=UPI001A9A5B2A|nr:hypothetical protein [Youngiibacter fragilis]